MQWLAASIVLTRHRFFRCKSSHIYRIGYRKVIFDVVHVGIKRQIQRWRPALHFITSSRLMPVLDTVECVGFKVEEEFVGEQFRTTRYQRQIFNTKNADISNNFSLTGKCSPVLETSQKCICVVVGFRFTCICNIPTLLLFAGKASRIK